MSRVRRPLLRSLRFAWDGLVEGAVRDRNLRIHLGIGTLVGAFVARAPLAPVERAVLALCIAAVVAAEAMNSAVEAAVDLVSPGPDERARIAKDSAAAAVLVVAAGSVVAFLAIAAVQLGELAAWAQGLPLRTAARLAAAALAAALGAALLPAGRRPPAADLLLLAAAAAGLALLARGAQSQIGTATAALCLAVGAGGAARRRRDNAGRP